MVAPQGRGSALINRSPSSKPEGSPAEAGVCPALWRDYSNRGGTPRKDGGLPQSANNMGSPCRAAPRRRGLASPLTGLIYLKGSKPRADGSLPVPTTLRPTPTPAAPPSWVVGYTFELSVSLPGPANKGGGSPKRKQKTGTGKTLNKATAKARKPKQPTVPDPLQEEATRQKQVEYDRRRNKSPERKEQHRRYAQEQRQQAKELGKCRNCTEPAIPGQTRCTRCAAAHRQSRRRSDNKRRATAKGNPPRVPRGTTGQASQPDENGV